MSIMTSYKRKRIERWCEDVAQYLKNGTICNTVLSNVAEDAICGATMVSNENTAETMQPPIDANNNLNYGSTASSSNLNSKVDCALKKATQALGANDVYYNISGGTGSVVIAHSSSNPHGNSFPAVKFAYSHYHEQRRKIDRLVQGLPVLTANGLSALERPSSKASTEDHVPIIIVNGEEPVRSNHTRSRSSSQLRRDRSQYPGCRANPLAPSNNNNSNIQQLQNHHRIPLESASSNFRHQNQPSSSPLHRGGSGDGGRKLYDFRSPATGHNMGVTVDPGLALTSNDRISRIKTAPVPNKNLHRARQRILTRRGNRVLESSSQIPLQNCWAMAELTW